MKEIISLWRRWWSSLGNVNRSSNYNPAKGECLLPVPTAKALEISSDDSTEDTKVYTPLRNGFIRGTIWVPTDTVIYGPVTNGGRTALLPDGSYGVLLGIRNTGGVDAVATVQNADAAAAVGNTIAVSETIPAGTEQSFLFTSSSIQFEDVMLAGPLWAIMSANSATYFVFQLYEQQYMSA